MSQRNGIAIYSFSVGMGLCHYGYFIRINFLLFNRVLARTHGIAIYTFSVGMGICSYGYFIA